jgi:hypothetical protein
VSPRRYVESGFRRILLHAAAITAVIAIPVALDLPGPTVLAPAVADAQTRFAYSAGQELSPSYEGWIPNDDGSFTLYFGYMNTNWLQEFDIPVGPDNHFEPGNQDMGQPTHFYPRRNPFLFTFRVPKDFTNKELTWTLTANGKTNKAYASLKTDYQIDPQVISTEVGGDNGSLDDSLRFNIPPDLRVEGDKKRTAQVGQPLSLVAIAGDPDNIPARRDRKPQPGFRKAAAPVTTVAGNTAPPPPAQRAAAAPTANATPNIAAQVYRPPVAVVASSGPGLRFSWVVYRGKAANATFAPDQMKTWIDTRAYANSPWSPPYIIPEPPADGKYTSSVTFSQPGTYQLRAVASDGSLFTYDDIVVTVTP